MTFDEIDTMISDLEQQRLLFMNAGNMRMAVAALKRIEQLGEIRRSYPAEEGLRAKLAELLARRAALERFVQQPLLPERTPVEPPTE